MPFTEGRFSCADPEFFRRGGGVGRGSKGYLGLLVVGMGKGLPSVQAVCSLFAYIR